MVFATGATFKYRRCKYLCLRPSKIKQYNSQKSRQQGKVKDEDGDSQDYNMTRKSRIRSMIP
jgi:hypothetical protein